MSGTPKTMAEALQDMRNNHWGYSEPKANEALGGWSMYPQDHSVQGRLPPCPKFILPPLIAPFLPSLGKGKTDTNAWTNLNLELSVRDHNTDVIEFYKELDAGVRTAVIKHSEKMYRKVMSPQDAVYKHRAILSTKTDGPPYLLRLKVHPTKTKFWKVISTNEDGVHEYDDATIDDIQRFCTIQASVTYKSVYAMPLSFGASQFATSVLIFPPQQIKREEEDAQDPKNFDFRNVGTFVDRSAPVEVAIDNDATDGAGDASATNTADGGDGGDGGDSDDDENAAKRVRYDED
ncbi:hypothetical protein OAM67_00210 [bacterium]|nr:hypothetical protein [bacterium]